MSLDERLSGVRDRIAEASRLAGRDPGELTLVVVTKFQPIELIRDLQALGVRDFGESRHQEAREKADALGDDVTWHFVGQLQGKKARQVRDYAHVIHSVDRESLVQALASDELETDVFAQINLTDDPARGGVAPGSLMPLVDQILAAPGLRLRGVMAVPPLDEEPRRAYARLRGMSEAVRGRAPGADAISAGMSGDFAEAIAEGATHLRIGTAITGERPPRG
ncbi:YggS family pyridoxal phosphate-dependent enzyme [Herbiconiux sp. L3-i23]|uniref:YggS family pyridoxal phosphate-dependent enzyme n=1 Tax=Herbiconiux sp. L3-i23 TaxID=2905871 RepID=UPI00205498A9|nr:YggS family pyridoxal phosphate-dependent enzyme [Herbiconiux sp. L3-i23]BDI22408.1 hypothetical protein L3i23_11840 [Herbiconiux sp. L3-i23]